LNQLLIGHEEKGQRETTKLLRLLITIDHGHREFTIAPTAKGYTSLNT